MGAWGTYRGNPLQRLWRINLHRQIDADATRACDRSVHIHPVYTWMTMVWRHFMYGDILVCVSFLHRSSHPTVCMLACRYAGLNAAPTPEVAEGETLLAHEVLPSIACPRIHYLSASPMSCAPYAPDMHIHTHAHTHAHSHTQPRPLTNTPTHRYTHG